MTVQLQRRRLLPRNDRTGRRRRRAAGDALACAADNAKQDKTKRSLRPRNLMREHGVLNRVLLIYDTVVRKIEGKEDFDPGVISSSARIVQQFIEGYHERNE